MVRYSPFTKEQFAQAIFSEINDVEVDPGYEEDYGEELEPWTAYPTSFFTHVRWLGLFDSDLRLVLQLVSRYLRVELHTSNFDHKWYRQIGLITGTTERADLEMIQLLRVRHVAEQNTRVACGAKFQALRRPMLRIRLRIAAEWSRMEEITSNWSGWRRRKLNCDGIPAYGAAEAVVESDHATVDASDDESTETGGDEYVETTDDEALGVNADTLQTVGEAVRSVHDDLKSLKVILRNCSNINIIAGNSRAARQFTPTVRKCAVFAESIEFLRQWQSHDTGRMLAAHVCGEQLPDELLNMIATAFYRIGCHRDILQQKSCVEIARNDVERWGPG